MSSPPDISIIIPTYNRAHYLAKAISCCQAQQGDFEIIISDNCSTDNTAEIVRSFLNDPRIRYYRNDRNLGMMGNWKKCIHEHARADWFVLMSDDDYFTDPDYLKDAWSAITTHRPKMVYGGGRIVNQQTGESVSIQLPFDGLVSGQEVFQSRGTAKPQDFILSNIVFNRHDAMRLGFPRNPLNLCSDSELFLHLCLEGQVFVINRHVIDYTLHGNNFITKVSQVKELYTSNTEYLIYPYLYAQQLGVPQQVIDTYLKNTHLHANIVNALIALKVNNTRWHQEYRQQLAQLAPALLKDVESSFLYFKRNLKASLFRAKYKKKYLLRELSANDY